MPNKKCISIYPNEHTQQLQHYVIDLIMNTGLVGHVLEFVIRTIWKYAGQIVSRRIHGQLIKVQFIMDNS